MHVPTIEKANMTSSYVTRVDQSGLNGIRPVLADGSLRACYAADRLIVKGEKSSLVQVLVYTADGTLVCHERTRLHEGTAYVDLSQLQAGLYIAHVIDEQGRDVTCKFVK